MKSLTYLTAANLHKVLPAFLALLASFSLSTAITASPAHAQQAAPQQSLVSKLTAKTQEKSDPVMFITRNLDISNLPGTTGLKATADKKTFRDYEFRIKDRSFRDITLENATTHFYVEIYSYDPDFQKPWEICISSRTLNKKVEWTRPYLITRQTEGPLLSAKVTDDFYECLTEKEHSAQ